MYIRDLQVTYRVESVYDHFRDRYADFHRKFAYHPCCIVDYLCYKTYRMIHTEKTAKIVFHFHLDDTTFTGKYDDWQGIITINSVFDFEKYLRCSDDSTKKEMLAIHISHEMQSLFLRESWDIAPVTAAFQELASTQYRIDGELIKHWYNDNRKYKAKLTVQYDLEAVDFKVHLLKGKTKDMICTRDFATFLPSYGCITEFLKTAAWASPTVFQAKSPGFAGKLFSIDFTDVMTP